MNISLKQVGLNYGTHQALKDITLELTEPSMVGLLGPNGAGKSSLMKLLVAQRLPSHGEILVNGHTLQSQEKQLKAELGYLPQRFGLYDELTVNEFLDYMCALKEIDNSKAEIERVIIQTNLEEKRRKKIRSLSGGQRQRVGIAQALLGTPKLLIFDEPTVGLDPEERLHFRNIFAQNATNNIVLLSTHIIEDIQSICNQLIVLDHGNILFQGTPQEMLLLAVGHVWMILEGEALPEDCHVTARVNSTQGVMLRVVGDLISPLAVPCDPSLEDAYLFLISKGGIE